MIATGIIHKNTVSHAFILGALLSIGASGPAEAKDSGVRLEVGPQLDYTVNSVNADAFIGTAATASGEMWGVGPLGMMARASYGISSGNVSVDLDSVTATVTYIRQAEIGPTLNFGVGPLRGRFGIGAWFADSQMSTDTVQHLVAQGYPVSADHAEFLGSVISARVDLNLPVFQPFAIADSRQQGKPSAYIQDPTQYAMGSDYQLTLGTRLTLLPFVKLGLAGFVGATNSSLNPLIEGIGSRKGAYIWLVVGI